MFSRVVAVGVVALLVAASVPARQDHYGAIAYSVRTERYGYSSDHENRERAERRALRECGADDCRVKVWFYNSCAALATGSEGRVTGWAHNYSLEEAKERARRECERNGGHRCHIVTSVCSR